MAQQIFNPHDKLFKQMLGERENAASFLQNNLPQALLHHLDLSRLEVVQASFIDAQFVQSEADLLFSVSIANRPGYVYVLFEHQSTPEPWMGLRLLAYMVRVWKRFLRDHPQGRSLPVIVPLVLFHGPKGWQGPVDFASLVDSPAQDFGVYVPDFTFRLFDLSGGRGERVGGNAAVRILGEVLGSLGQPDFKERIIRAFETLNELAHAPHFARYFEILFRYALQVHELPKTELMDLTVEALKPDVRESIMTTYEQLIQEGKELGIQHGKELGIQEGKELGIQEGKELGIQEGMKEGGKRILARLLSKQFGTDIEEVMSLLVALNSEQQEELSDKIPELQSLEQLRCWLSKIGKN